ncbi:hypothetical protein SAMN05421505_12016 [Sinosporangium album]|uniref:Uncharacterized protein n=1 Tax=Sinosporangium album TaxID=504805 RepID=A0A1G8EAT3_9ACTN|nr:hypothetical protein [Sinosporangium album]SDH67006.1 hypothetical protein SAMN05421505_12016 [Sinosporangium album]
MVSRRNEIRGPLDNSADLPLDAIREELIHLWNDMCEARLNAYEGCWSGTCENLERRIKLLTPLVGPISWKEVQVELLAEEVFQRIHADMGYTVVVDMDEVAHVLAENDEPLIRLTGSRRHIERLERDRQTRLAAVREHWRTRAEKQSSKGR